jgi:hypothetical protein
VSSIPYPAPTPLLFRISLITVMVLSFYLIGMLFAPEFPPSIRR